jgi:hypothetical protein
MRWNMKIRQQCSSSESSPYNLKKTKIARREKLQFLRVFSESHQSKANFVAGNGIRNGN